MKIATITGHLGSIQTRTSQEGNFVLNFSVATYDGKDQQNNNKTLWFNCVMFGKYAETISTKLSKGTKLCCYGEIGLDEYQDKSGANRSSLTLRVSVLEVLNKDAPNPNSAPTNNYNTNNNYTPSLPSHNTGDDIPF